MARTPDDPFPSDPPPDIARIVAYRDGEPNRRAIVISVEARTGLLVGLTKDDAVLGFILNYRKKCARSATGKSLC